MGRSTGVVDFMESTIPEDGFFLVAEPLFSLSANPPDLLAKLNFENGENATYLLVDQLGASSGTDLDADDDGILESTPWASIIDGLSLVDDEATILTPNGTQDIDYSDFLGIPAIGPAGTFPPVHVFASPFFPDTYFVGAFQAGLIDTPGVANFLPIPEPTSIGLLICDLLAGAHRVRSSSS